MKTVKLGDLFNLRNGYTPSKQNKGFWENGTIPWFRMDDIRQNGNILSDSLQHITPEAVKGKLFKANSIIMGTTATVGVHSLILNDFLCNQQFTNFEVKDEYKNEVDPKYLYHYFYLIDDWCLNHVNTSSFASVDMNRLKRLDISYPELNRQKEIVSILNLFESLISFLENEIKLRQKQYEYYRRELLSYPKTTLLGDVVDIIVGGDVPKDNYSETKTDKFSIPIISNGVGDNAIYGFTNKARITEESVTISSRGTIGYSEYRNYPYYPIVRLICLIPKEGLNAKFLKYQLDESKIITPTTGIKQLTAPMVKKIKISIPPLEKQLEIVSILDNIENLISLLEKETDLRKKQLYYYRRKLLEDSV